MIKILINLLVVNVLELITQLCGLRMLSIVPNVEVFISLVLLSAAA